MALTEEIYYKVYQDKGSNPTTGLHTVNPDTGKEKLFSSLAITEVS
jgi:hypothetical protein